jgi:hypothetical protein
METWKDSNSSWTNEVGTVEPSPIFIIVHPAGGEIGIEITCILIKGTQCGGGKSEKCCPVLLGV